MTDAQLLEKVKRGWRCDETPCGHGSTITETESVRRVLPKLVRDYKIKTVSDAGAGDLHWMRLVRWEVYYAGYDLYPRHPNVTQFDITKEVLPKSDMILCRHVLNHLSIQYSERALDNFRASGSTYLLMTNCDTQRDYWTQYGLSIGEPLESWNDSTKWELELYTY